MRKFKERARRGKGSPGGHRTEKRVRTPSKAQTSRQLCSRLCPCEQRRGIDKALMSERIH